MTTSRQSPRMLDVDLLHGHRQNVRDQVGDITELAASIRQHGLVQPIVVTEHPDRPGQYLILAGHRRTEAARTVGLSQVPCLIRHDAGTVDDHVALMLVENMQRRNLSAVEKARAMKKLIDRGMSQVDVARRIGVTPTTVNTHIMLLDLSDDELAKVEAGEVLVQDAKAAVRAARSASRSSNGAPVRGRPIQIEPRHLAPSHPLADSVRDSCDHSRRPKVGGVGCGQCWEAAIREDVIREAAQPGDAA